ncbi:diacylglycerol/lipid kinase family protein [Jatrophihabitans sp. YIM 134969]
MARIARVVVVFNPHSSGDGERSAREFQERLHTARPDLPVELVATERAGHGRELAARHGAGGTPDAVVLVVSASGDGGYHDVVNGVLDAGGSAAGVAAAVLPAGNANDHRRTTARRPLVDAVADDDLSRLDLLTVQRSDASTEYAHSYIGIGVTAAVAVGLEESGGKGSIGEVLTTLRVLRRLVPVVLERDGRRRQFDAIVASTVSGMAKYVTLDAEAEPDDGRFEVIELGHLPVWRYPGVLVRAATGRLPGRRGMQRYAFRTTDVTPLQLDGEVRELPARADVTIGIAPGALLTVR